MPAPTEAGTPDEEFVRRSEPFRRELLAYCYRMLSGSAEVPWLQPAPDALFGSAPADPAAIVEARQTLRLGFIAALQYLSGRQRAVLILRDAPAWRASEVAGLLGTTTAAVNSAMQRARAQLSQVAPTEDGVAEPADPARRALLDRYAAAFESADVSVLTGVLTDDVVWEMPPIPTWFARRETVLRFLAARVLAAGEQRMIPTGVNGQPAFGSYSRDGDGVYRAHALQVLTVTAAGVDRVVAFLDAGLFGPCGLPPALDGAAPRGGFDDQRPHTAIGR